MPDIIEQTWQSLAKLQGHKIQNPTCYVKLQYSGTLQLEESVAP